MFDSWSDRYHHWNSRRGQCCRLPFSKCVILEQRRITSTWRVFEEYEQDCQKDLVVEKHGGEGYRHEKPEMDEWEEAIPGSLGDTI